MISQGTLALIELALETGTPPKKLGHGQMYDDETGQVCFFGFVGRMHGLQYVGTRVDTELDSEKVAALLELPHNKLIKYAIEADNFIRWASGDSSRAIPQIMNYLRNIPPEKHIEPDIDEPPY